MDALKDLTPRFLQNVINRVSLTMKPKSPVVGFAMRKVMSDPNSWFSRGMSARKHWDRRRVDSLRSGFSAGSSRGKSERNSAISFLVYQPSLYAKFIVSYPLLVHPAPPLTSCLKQYKTMKKLFNKRAPHLLGRYQSWTWLKSQPPHKGRDDAWTRWPIDWTEDDQVKTLKTANVKHGVYITSAIINKGTVVGLSVHDSCGQSM